MKLTTMALVLLASSAAQAQVMKSPDRTVNRSLPEDSDFRNDTGYKKLYEEAIRREETARSTLREANGGPAAAVQLKVPSPASAAAAPVAAGKEANAGAPPAAAGPAAMQPAFRSPPPSGIARTLPKRTKVKANRLYLPTLAAHEDGDGEAVFEESAPTTGTQTFAVSKEAAFDETTTVLPAGSFVKARVVSGVEANTLEPYPVLLQLEYAFTGPNKTKIDLSNCFMIAKARANLSTERVIMETDTLSCVRENGEHFKTQARGYTAGEDSTFGSTGTFISKQGQVLLAAVLASIAKNAGEAVAAAQTTTTVAAGGIGAAQAATNVTGDQAKYIAGRSAVDGASIIAQWYLDYAKQLVPSIGIGSGQMVHVIMLDTIRVPNLQE